VVTVAAVRTQTAGTAGFADPAEHLRAELARLELELARQVLRRRMAGRYAGDPAYRGLYVPDELVDALVRPPAATPADGELLAGHDDRIRVARSRAAVRAAATPDGILRLPELAARFGLDRMDADALLLALAPELDQRYATLISWLQDDATLRRPTVGLVADLWGDPIAVRARFDPGAPLVSGRLITLAEPGAGTVPAPLLDRALVPAGRVVAHLLGDDRPDPAVRDCLRPYREPVAPVSLGELAIVDDAAAGLRQAAALLDEGRCAVAVLTGPPGCGKRAAALALAAALGRPYLVLDPALAAQREDRSLRGPQSQANDTAAGVPDLLDLTVREARLAGATLVVCGADLLAGADPPSGDLLASGDIRPGAGLLVASRLAELGALGHRVVLTGTRPWYRGLDPAADWFEVTLSEPGYVQRRTLWRRTLGSSTSDSTAVDAVADAFRLGPGQITAAARMAVSAGRIDHSGLSSAARAVSTNALDRLARRVRTPYRWADLVLPDRTRRQLDEFVAAVRHRARVQVDWGFADRRGLHVLFCGPSGTGKTMSAALVAGELGLDLYAVDLAAVVSKYIGETEKNLDAVFAEGRASNAMLLFDEADALFGRRSEVKDAHDRYANLEVAYLLQRIEAYDGVTVLATNLRGNLDEAFARRLAHSIDFPAPDAALRARIWRVALPAAAPLAADVDLDFLAQRIELTGAGIRNSAVTAAYLAAAGDRPIAMADLVQGVARELQKTGRLPSRAAFGAYYEHLAERDGGGGP
jgi:MoxR-like ATPase